MSDPRLTPNPAFTSCKVPAEISVSVTDLCRSADGPRDRQVIFGEHVTILGEEGDWIYVQAEKDSYCGFLNRNSTRQPSEPTHFVAAPATHLYQAPDFKSADLTDLSFGSQISVEAEINGFFKTKDGYIPQQHVRLINDHFGDFVGVAELFLGTPYLWGGNSRQGIDCSGLIQAALLACGVPCPGDSDMQQATLGEEVSDGYRRNDLLFWKGHVALVCDTDRIIHANAGAMSTVFEPITEAIERIETQGDSKLVAHRRITRPRG